MANSKTKKDEKKREIKYPNFDVIQHIGPAALTIDEAKDYLGWQTEDDYLISQTPDLGEEEREAQRSKAAFGDTFDFRDEEGNKVRLLNNGPNRPFDVDLARRYAMVVLNRQWADSRNSQGEKKRTCNGESGSIGETGLVLSSRHRLAGLALAGQIRLGSQKKHWTSPEFWPGEPTMEIILSVGVDESPETIATLDNGKPRTLADVLFSDGGVFANSTTPISGTERYKLCKAVSGAVKLLWVRTEADRNVFSPNRTHTGDLDFISRHDRILKAVEFINKVNKNGGIERYLPLGYSATLLYLMGSSSSDAASYDALVLDGTASERKLKWAHWNKACEFWRALGEGASEMISLHDLRRPNFEGKIDEGDKTAFVFGNGVGKGGFDERVSSLCKAWLVWKEGEKLTTSALRLRYKLDSATQSVELDEWPDIGGIDFANPTRKAKKKGETLEEEDDEAQIEEAKAEAERLAREQEEAGERTREGPVKRKRNGKKEVPESALDRAARIARENSEKEAGVAINPSDTLLLSSSEEEGQGGEGAGEEKIEKLEESLP